ncbi:diaminopimelate epimerase [Marinifilum sp. N1E240]|uniref:diaminopimelate epimerase n=1 Tax=Marinifilum sp. N1E240 TaxID=2608082 RepID=UPI00128B72B3|nr:diaminopimelate epimerase [Marinifilum sp. N1E240]MPQ47665.1 diaminopimelate epimerase [Marinifilum sp. N1E240]
MQIEFSKYQGTGNDFVLIDNRNGIISPDNIKLIEQLCHRRFGIGADGLMLLEDAKGYDFRMRYFNSDGKEASMCGNGGRCIVAFAYHLGIIKNETTFIAVDGEHEAKVEDKNNFVQISLKMINVSGIEKIGDSFFMNTGSPHFVQFIQNHDDFDTYSNGKAIRYNDRFAAEGTNVNFVSFKNNEIQVSTYERGVEDETYSCGTGVVASAISAGAIKNSNSFKINTKGGKLAVHFNKIDSQNINDIWLIGPATKVFSGSLNI